MLRAASAGHIYYSTGRGETPPTRRPAVQNRRTSPRRGNGPQAMSDALLHRLSEISQQLGATTAGIEALREDLKDSAETSKAFSADTSARIENLTMRMADVEKTVNGMKSQVDAIIMPVVEEINDRKMQVSGALKVWGTILLVGGGLSAVFWSRVLNFLVWATGNGSSPP